jgi:uncharacterized membrane protein YdbT with pleckstrin-like domain
LRLPGGHGNVSAPQPARRRPAEKGSCRVTRYVNRVLQPEEVVVLVTRLHAIIYVRAMLHLAVAAVLLIASLSFSGDVRMALQIAALIFGMFALVSWACSAIRQYTTELAVTDRRVIYKAGLFSRHTLEMNRSKVESVDVNQTVLGRLLGFGTIIVRGTGGSLEPIRLIRDPLAFRSTITAG